MIEVRDLRKSYGPVTALNGLDLEIPDGEFLTVFGPNGAGKTTFTKILATLTNPSGGEVLIDGEPLGGEETRSKIGLVSHKSFLYGDLTAHENLKFYGRMYGVEGREGRIEEALELVGLSRRRNEPVRGFSRGMEQRLAIARALLHDPSLLILDEPYTGLDLSAAETLRDILSDLRKLEKTVVMTTHDMERGLEFCHRAIIMLDGEMVHEEVGEVELEEFRRAYREKTSTGEEA